LLEPGRGIAATRAQRQRGSALEIGRIVAYDGTAASVVTAAGSRIDRA
jgi:hypothetical protein